MVEDLPLAAVYLGDTFDLPQTNQPEGMDFHLYWKDGLVDVHRHTTRKTHASKHLFANTQICTHTQTLPQDSHKLKLTRCQCHPMILLEQFKVQTLSLEIYNMLLNSTGNAPV